MALPRRAVVAGLAALVVVASGPSAHAREDDVEYALGLAQRGYYDLADAEIARMLKGSASPEKRTNAQFTRCEMLRRAALVAAGDDKSPPAEVRDRFAAAQKAFQEFLASGAQGRRKADAEFNQANLLKDFAYFLNKRLAEFPDPAAIRKEADKTFDDAIKALTVIRDREQEAGSGLDPANEERFSLRNEAWYYLCVAMHDRSMLLPPGDPVRIQQLTKLIDGELNALLEETDGDLPGYYAGMYLGLACWHRGQQKDGWNTDDIRTAKDWFSVPMDAADRPDAPTWPALMDAIFKSAHQFGVMCNEVGNLGGSPYPRLFIEKMATLEAKLPTVRKTSFGLQAIVEKARAMAAAGLHEAAIKELNQVTVAAATCDPRWARQVDREAKRALNLVISSIPPDSPVKLNPEILFKAGDGSIQEGKPGQAIRAFQRVLLSCEAVAEPGRRQALLDEFHAKSWNQIFWCYSQLERYREAFLAADQPVQRYLAAGRSDEDQTVADAASNRLRALQALAQQTKDAGDFEAVRVARELLTTKFGYSTAIGNQNYVVASQKMMLGYQAVSQGDKEGATKAFAEAVDSLRKVPEKEAQHRIAQARVGEAFVQMGKNQEAIQHLEAFLKKWAPFFADTNTPGPQRQPQGVAVFWIAQAYDSLKQPAKVVELLADYEKRFASASLETFYPRAAYSRVLALLAIGKVPEAEAAANRLKADSPDNAYTPSACLAAANALYKQRDEVKATDRHLAKELLGRSVSLYDFWVSHTADPGAEDWKFVGLKHLEMEAFDRGAEMLQKSLDEFRAAADEKNVEIVTVLLAGVLVEQGRFPEALPKLESLFIKTPENLDTLRDCFASLSKSPAGTDLKIFKDNLQKTLKSVVERALQEPGAAGVEATARKAVAGEAPDTEAVLRAFDASAQTRRALSAGTAFTLLGSSNTMSANLRNAVFALVRRQPELMGNLSRCYDELSASRLDYAIASINLYQMLLDAAEATTDRPRAPGTRYSERWFDWKYRMIRVYLKLGIAVKQDGPLLTVCAFLKSMTSLEELQRSDEEREGFSKEFLALKIDAEAGLRKLGKGGCE